MAYGAEVAGCLSAYFVFDDNEFCARAEVFGMGLLRLLLALTVVFSHSPWADGHVFVGGRNAVQMFYMISGFLMHHILANGKAYGGHLNFYKSRFLRIYPVYYVVAACSLLYHIVANDGFFLMYESIPTSAAAVLVAANAFIFGQDWVMFLGVHQEQLVFTSNFRESAHLLYRGLLIPQAWTLGVELSFYLLAPFVLTRLRLMLALLLGSVIVRVVLVIFGLAFSDPWTNRFFPAELSFFLVGALSNRYLLPLWQSVVKKFPARQLPAASVWALVALCTAYFYLPGSSSVKSAMLFAVFACLLPLTLMYNSESRLDRKIGDLSYPLYVSHMLVIWVVGDVVHRFEGVSTLLITMANVGASLLVATLLNRYVGDVVEGYRTKLRPVQRVV